MGTKSRESIYGASVRAAAEHAAEARQAADRVPVDRRRRMGSRGVHLWPAFDRQRILGLWQG
jgi:hypothetical protein